MVRGAETPRCPPRRTHPRPWRGTWLRAAALLAGFALAAAGCLPGGGGRGEQDGSEPGAGPAAEEADRLVVWDIYVRGAEQEVADRLTEEFEEEHGVTVDREPKNLDDLKVTLPLAMGQADGPDVASVNQGRPDMGAMVEAGLLMDLTELGREQGWFDIWGAGLLQRSMFSEDGQTFGSGNLYGVSPQAEIVGWYYNKEKLARHGLEPPETFAELETLLAALKQAGETPIAFGNLEGWPAIHTYGALEHTLVDTDYLNGLIFRTADAGFARPENVEAAAMLQRWVDHGYFTENFSGIAYDDSWAQFAAGSGALLLTGSWIAGELDPRSFGFFLTPGRTPSELPPQMGGMGVPLAIRADTRAAELAKEYLAWMTSEEASEQWLRAWLPSRTPPEGAVEGGTLMADLVGSWDRVLEQDKLGHYLDWATPTFYDTLTASLQQLLAGSVDPQGFVGTLQADYDAAG
jgi:raffinose/stachyose/melibiose transport system substrate-binding protein